MLRICQSKQLSFRRRRHPTMWWLIIDSLRLCCLSHTFSPSVCLCVSPLPLSFFPPPKIRHRLRHESCRPVFGSVTSDFLFFFLLLLLPPCSHHHHHTQHPPQQPLLLWHLPGRRGDPRISPLICLLNPGVDSIRPGSMSERGRSETPRCLTLHKLTRGPSALLSLPFPSHLLQSQTKHWGKKKKETFWTVMERQIQQIDVQIWCSFTFFVKHFCRWTHTAFKSANTK